MAARLLSSSSTVANPGTEKDVLVCRCLLLVFSVPALKFISTSIRERRLTGLTFGYTLFRLRNFLSIT